MSDRNPMFDLDVGVETFAWYAHPGEPPALVRLSGAKHFDYPYVSWIDTWRIPKRYEETSIVLAGELPGEWETCSPPNFVAIKDLPEELKSMASRHMAEEKRLSDLASGLKATIVCVHRDQPWGNSKPNLTGRTVTLQEVVLNRGRAFFMAEGFDYGIPVESVAIISDQIEGSAEDREEP